MVNIVKCKPKTQECAADKKKEADSKNTERQQGGDAKAADAKGAGPDSAAKGKGKDGKDGETPCPSNEEKEKGKKADAAAKNKKGEGEPGKGKAPCGPEKAEGQGQEKKKKKRGGAFIKKVEVEPQLEVVPRVIHPQNFSYGVPRLDLDRSALKFPEKSEEEKESETQDKKNIGELLGSYRKVNQTLIGMLEKQQRTAIQSSQRIHESFLSNTNHVLSDHRHLDALLLDNYRSRIQELGSLDRRLRRKIEGARLLERLMIFGIAGKGRIDIRKKINTVQASIDGTVTNILKPYTDSIEAVSGATKKSISSILTSMSQWQAGIDGAFSTGGSNRMENAANEGRRQVAKCKVTEEVSKLECKEKDVPEELKKLTAPFEAFARASIDPPMREEAKNAEQCGFKAVDSAVSRAVVNLEEATKTGLKAVKSSVRATRSRLTQQLNASRSSLRKQADAQLERLKKEAETADKRVAQAHENQKQGMTGSVETYRQSIIDAAPDGVSSAKSVASSGGGQTVDTFQSLRKSHIAQCEKIETGSREGMSAAHTAFWTSSNEAVVDQNENANALTSQTQENLTTSTDSRIEGMGKLKNGVSSVTQLWAMDMATKYKEMITKAEGRLKKCKKGFESDLKAKKGEVDSWLKPREKPAQFFKKDLDEIATKVKEDVYDRVTKLSDEFDDTIVYDDVITDAIRGVTDLQGSAVVSVYRSETGRSLYSDIREYTSGDDKSAIYAYLSGDEAKGAEYELKASIGFFNDDEARIRKTMRSLDDENLKKFLKRDSAKGTLADVKDNLDGVDLDVFNALTDESLPHLQRLAKADAYDLEDKLKKARTREEVNQEIANFYSNNPDRGYGDDVSNEELRRAINDQMAVVRDVKDKEGKPVTGEAADKAMEGFVTQKHNQIKKREQMQCRHGGHGGGGGCYKSEKRQRFDKAQEDRSKALINHGVGSKEDKIALLGIEANRSGGGKMENIDKNLVDPRLNPNVLDPKHYQDRVVPESAVKAYNDALKERQQILEGVAKTYGNPDSSGGKSVNDQVINLLSQGQSDLGRKVINGLVTETFPSANTSSMLIEYAAGGYFDGTNEALMKQATTRLDKEQITAAEGAYALRHPGQSLWKLVASETSGQDFLDMELAWMGKPRNDREKAEVALFAIHQQKRETGSVGKSLMSGSRSESIMLSREKRLQGMVGNGISFSKRGDPPSVTIRNANFDKKGKFKGDSTDLVSTATAAQGAAENYSKNIDEWADGITTGIAILGAVIATVVTGGGAAPLLAAAIAGGIGLASMAAKYAIKGGRYGWEEALTDLGMTGVQMLTAGLGQKLQAIAAASKTMGPLQQALLPTVVTGGLDSMGQAVFNEGTWKDGFGKGLEEVLAGTMKGVLTATVATLGAQALQKIPIGKALNSADDLADDAAGAARKFRTIGDLTESTNYFSRSAAQSFQSAGSSFMSTGAGIGFDALRGKYKGNWEDAFKEMGKSAGQAGFQGIFEGAGEAWRDKNKVKFGMYTRPGWMDPGEYAALTAPPSRNQQSQSGTAAAVDGSRFRGDLHDTPVVKDTHVSKGLKDLTADGGFLNGKARLDPEGDGMRIMLKLDDGSEIPIHFKTVDEMTLTEKGVPVAEFHGDGDGFAVHVSSKADPEMIQRAMVHELTEIRALKRPNANTDDVLKPGGPTQRRPEDQPQLSPHDRARIAELEFMQRQIDVARGKRPPDEARIRQLNDETMSLLAHLGVVNDTPGAKHRRELLNDHLPNTRLRDAIDASIKATREETRFQYRGADHDAALDMLVRQWQQHKDVGDTASADMILKQIRRRLMRMEHISTDRRFKDQQQKLTDTIDQVLKNPELVDAMKTMLKEDGVVEKSHLINDPAADDPHGAHAVRREFGDNPNFQDWPSFREKFFKTFDTAKKGDPIHLDRAYQEWSTGAYVNEQSGRMRSVLSDVSRPHPDFQHKWKAGKKPEAIESAKLKGDQQLDHSLTKLFEKTDPGVIKDGDLSDGVQQKIKGLADADPQTPLTVNDAASLRHDLLGEARRIDAILKAPGDLDAPTLARLKKLHHDLEHQAIKLTETLGEAAAKKVAELEKGNWDPVPLDGQGSGLPDVVFRNRETGKLLIIEAKGGGSQLGTRLSSDQRTRVEQGTRAYLESLAKTMLKSSSKKTQDLGQELLNQLAKPDGVDYRLVKQKFDTEGNPQAPDVGQFDIGDPPNAAETHRNAAAIPDSKFHGDRRWILRNKEKHLVKAANELLESNIGIGEYMAKVNGEENSYFIESPDGKRIKVEIEPVAASQLPKHETGRANAQWEQVKTPSMEGGPDATYRIQVSDRMDPTMIGRALAHDFREVYQDFKAGGNTKEKVTKSERQLDLNTPHGQARLEEIAWLNRKIADSGKKDGGIYAKELATLLKHIGADPAPDNRQRRKEVADILLGKGLMTPAIWKSIDGPDLVKHAAPIDNASIDRVKGQFTDFEEIPEVSSLLTLMRILQHDTRAMHPAPNPDNRQRVQDMQNFHAELVKQVGAMDMHRLVEIHKAKSTTGEPPDFESLMKLRDDLYKSVGISPAPSLSRQDLEIHLGNILKLHQEGELGSLYGLYNQSRVPKTYEGKDVRQAQSDRQVRKKHRDAVFDMVLDRTKTRSDSEESLWGGFKGDEISVGVQPKGYTKEGEPDTPRILAAKEKIMQDIVNTDPSARSQPEPDTFIHFYSNDKANEARHRIYINVAPEKTVDLMNAIIDNILRNQSIDASSAKTHSGIGQALKRSEGIVVYIRDDASLETTRQWLLEYQKQHPDHFVPAVPRLTEQFAHGMGTANEPTDGTASFGTSRSAAIGAALKVLETYPPEQQNYETLLGLVEQELKKRGIDPDNPHVNEPPKPKENKSSE